MPPRNVLLGQLGAKGDCVYATTVARQIKADDPDCRLTWAIGSMCKDVIRDNPHVDEVWEIPLASRAEMATTWQVFEAQARQRERRGDFDAVYFTQIFPNNFGNFDGTVRASIFRGYPRAITVPVTPVIRLTADELANVEAFVRRHDLGGAAPVVFIECAALSGQSYVTPAWALEVGLGIKRRLPDARVVLSNGVSDLPPGQPVVDGGVLGFREVAALTRHCALFIGCSSGLTWVSTSDAATPIPMIQALNRSTEAFGAVVHDLEHWGLPTSQVIEMRDADAARVASCAIEVLLDGVAPARARYNEPLELRFNYYADHLLALVGRGDLRAAASSLRYTIGRYGLCQPLVKDVLGKVGERLRKRLPL